MSIFPKSGFTWLLVVFMIYAYYINYKDSKEYKSLQTAQSNRSANSISNSTHGASNLSDTKDATIQEKVLGKISANPTGKAVLEALVKKSFEDKYGKKNLQVVAAGESGELTIIDILHGNGAPLHCGAQAVINYEAFLSNGLVFDSTISQEKNSPITIKIGGSQVIKGLEIGILGMMEGGKRKLSIAPKFAFDNPAFVNSLVNKGEVVSYDVELVDIKDGPYKTTDNTTTVIETNGHGIAAMCGDKVKVKYSITSAAGNTTGDTTFVIGSGNVPMGIEFAAQGMSAGGTKTIQMPSSLLRSAGNSSAATAVKFTMGEVAQATVEMLEVGGR